MPVGGIRAVANGQYGPATWANVYHFMVTGTPPAEDLVAADVETWIERLYESVITEANLHTSWSFDYTTIVYRVDTSSLYRTRKVVDAVGTASGGGQDAQVAYLINWFTEDPRRGGKARQYIPGVPDSVVADSARLDTGILATMQTAMDTWIAEGPAGTLPHGTHLELVEMSFVADKSDRAEGFPYVIFGGAVNPVVATQRRRVDRVRPH